MLSATAEEQYIELILLDMKNLYFKKKKHYLITQDSHIRKIIFRDVFTWLCCVAKKALVPRTRGNPKTSWTSSKDASTAPT